MANIKITALPANTSVTPGSDVLPLVSAGVTTKATPSQIVNATLLAPGPIGSTTPGSANFTTLNVANTVSGAGFSNYLASPPPIGSNSANSGRFTTLTVNGSTTLNVGLNGLLQATSGVISNATAGVNYAPATSGTSILYGNGSGGFSGVTIGSGLTFSSGTLSATGGGGGSGTVTSVGLSLPNIFNVTNSPVTTTGTLTGALATQTANYVFAGPTTGSAAVPTFRSLVASDIPALSYAPATTGSSILYANGSGGFSSVTVGSGLTFSAGTLASTASVGTVTSVSVVSANGLAGTVANASSTPAITLSTSITGLLKGNGTAISAATAGTDYAAATTGTNTQLLANNGSGGFSNVTVGSGLTLTSGTLAATSGGGGTVTNCSVVSANGFGGTVATSTTTPAITLTTSITGLLKGNGTAVSAATSGTDYAPATSGSSILYGNGSGGFSNVTIGSNLTFSSGTLSATGGGGMTYPGAGIANSTGSAWGTSYTTTGTGTVVALATSPTFVTPILGTPQSGTLTSCTGLPISSGVSGLATGVATFLATPTSANLAAALTDETGTGANVFATSPTLVTPILGTPTSGTLTSCTGLPISTGVSGLGSNVATFLATPSSANLASALTDETGSGSAVFATSPTLVTPTLGVASATTVNKVTLTAPATGSTLTIADGKTLTASNTLTFTGTDASSVAFGAGGTVIYSGGALGTPSSGTLSSCSGLPISTGVSGLGSNVATFLATPSSANLASALTDETGSGSAVFATSPTLVTPTLGVASATSVNKVTLTAPATGSTLTIADGKTLTASNSITLAGTDSTTMTFPPASASVGYLNIPQNAQTSAYTLVLADSGKHIYMAAAQAATTMTIPANGTVAFPIGTAVTFVNMSANAMTIAITTDTMYLGGTGTTGSRTLAQYGTATALKMTSTTWIISGSGLT